MALSRRPSKTREDWVNQINFEIRDATEALDNAVKMRRWEKVIKYARQLEVLEGKLFSAKNASTRSSRVSDVMSRERTRRYNVGRDRPRTRRRRAR